MATPRCTWPLEPRAHSSERCVDKEDKTGGQVAGVFVLGCNLLFVVCRDFDNLYFVLCFLEVGGGGGG